MKDMQDRITELEIRFTHQASLIDELNEEVLGCYRRLASLESDNGRMSEMLKSLAPSLTESPDE